MFATNETTITRESLFSQCASEKNPTLTLQRWRFSWQFRAKEFRRCCFTRCRFSSSQLIMFQLSPSFLCQHFRRWVFTKIITQLWKLLSHSKDRKLCTFSVGLTELSKLRKKNERVYFKFKQRFYYRKQHFIQVHTKRQRWRIFCKNYFLCFF